MSNSAKKKSRAGLVIALVLLAALAAGAWWFFNNYAIYRGQIVPRNVTELDLRGEELTAEELTQAEEMFADAHILRDIVIGGKTYASDETDIAVGTFTRAEIPRFREFDALKSVDATESADLDAVLALREAVPELSVTWTVPLGDDTLDGDATAVELEDADAAELTAALARLPFVGSVTLTKSTLAPAEQLSLMKAYPAVSFGWDVLLGGKRFPLGTETLDFEDVSLTEAQLDEIGTYLPLMETAAEIRLGTPEASGEAVRAFADAHPEVSTVWNASLFGVDFSTEAEELVFDDIALTTDDAAQIEAMVPYMHNLTRVSMQRCGIGNDDMEAIYRRHIDDGVKFVWMVQVYNRGVPTDQTFFHAYQWSNPNTDYYYKNSNGTREQLRYCHDMIAMDMGHQGLYGDPDMFANMPHLKYLVLSSCQHTSLPTLGQLQELVWLEMFWTNCSDITYLVNCKNLQHLNIAYKRVRDREADLDTLKQMTWLKRLYFSHNMYKPNEVEALRAALPDTDIFVIYTDDCASLGWRNGDQAYFDSRDALHMYYMNDDNNMVKINPYTGEPSPYEWVHDTIVW